MKRSTFAALALAALAFGLADLQTPVQAAPAAAPSGSWLDKATPNWNQPGATLPRSPAPTSPSAQSVYNWWTGADSSDGPSILSSSPEDKQYFERCQSLLRPATLPEDKLLEEAGWVLFGQAHVFGKITVVMAMAAVDGMCRPNQYQAFVFSDGRFAGSLSPVLMDSRTDGAIDTIRFIQDSTTAKDASKETKMAPYASFKRYQTSDPLCCPSATSEVMYRLATENGKPVVAPQLPAQTSSNCAQ